MVPRQVDTHCGRERPWYRHRCLPLCIQPDAYPSEPGDDPPDIAKGRTLLPHQPSPTCHSLSGNLPSSTHGSQVSRKTSSIISLCSEVVRTSTSLLHRQQHCRARVGAPGRYATRRALDARSAAAVSHGLDECQELREGRATCRSCGDGGCCVTNTNAT